MEQAKQLEQRLVADDTCCAQFDKFCGGYGKQVRVLSVLLYWYCHLTVACGSAARVR